MSMSALEDIKTRGIGERFIATYLIKHKLRVSKMEKRRAKLLISKKIFKVILTKLS